MNLDPAIADALARGVTVIAASPRAARALRLRYAQDQQAAGHRVWTSPAILDWDSWLRDLWLNCAFAADAPLLLSPLQECALWTRVQRDDAALVLSPDSMAALAMEAWSLLSAFEAHAARRLSWEQPDAERFRQWTQEFDRECAAHGWMSASQLASRLAAAPVEALGVSGELSIVGFDRLTPAQAQLIAALRQRGIVVNEYAPDSVEGNLSWIAADGMREEIAACAAWAREILLRRPQARIGIITPAPDDSRGEIERAFRAALLPSANDIRRRTAPAPFEFSLGRPLAEVPAVRAALVVLRWIAGPLDDGEVSWLLLSGFVADTVTNHLAAARHEAARRGKRSLAPRHSLEEFRASLGGAPGMRGLHDRLELLQQTVQANALLDRYRPPSSFAELAHELLERIGWPGERPADSFQYQALQRWQRLLDDVALLDFDGSLWEFRDFVAAVERAAGEAVFAAESSGAPVQILGPLESAGQQFDALWFLSADDTRWPATGHPHPLLPPAIQRQFHMPHAVPRDDWELANTVTARLLRSAEEVVFSYARRDGEAALRPSPLITALFAGDSKPTPAGSLHASRLPRIAALETIPDDAVSLPWPRERHAGGADVLRRQAACPFQAFASKRLGAEELEQAAWGFTPAERGILLHKVAQRLFSQSFRTRDELRAVVEGQELAGVLDAHIEAVFRDLPPAADGWQEAYLAAEKRRLHTRLAEWLACEARRQPFTVETCEAPLRDVRVGELRLDLRADRIDLLPDGSRLLIDYKTGSVSPAAWQGDRPDEPQLPLYAVCGNVANVSGVLFAKIRAGGTGFDGRVRDARAQLFEDLKTTRKLVSEPYTRDMAEDWSRALHALAQEFLDGERAVSPREPEVCERCSLPALCRKGEQGLIRADEGEEEDDA